MANIALTTSCNLDCSYCFAKKFRGMPQEGNIKFADFTQAVNWINSSDEPEKIGIIGGEPLMHPLFDDFMELLRMKRRCPDQPIQIFSNGILLDEHIDSIRRAGASVAVNVNSPEDIGDTLYQKVFNNLTECRMKGVPFGIGINLYRPMDLGFLYDIIKEFGIDSFRVGLTAPNEPGKSAFDYFSMIEESYIGLVEESARLGAAAGIDCLRLPSCFYEKYETRISNLIEKTGFDIETGQDCRHCVPVIDITPTLHLTRCFGTLRQGLLMPMKAFRTPHDAEEFYRVNIDNIAQLIPMEEKCESCYEKAIGGCQGGCLGFKLDRFLEAQAELKKIISKPSKTVDVEFM